MGSTQQEEERVLKSRLYALVKREEIYWKLRSRVNWLAYGDKNWKFFHQTTLSRRRRNKILIKGSDGQWIEGENDIMKELHGFYADLFKVDGPGLTSEWYRDEIISCFPIWISDEDNKVLVRPTNEEELRRAVSKWVGLEPQFRTDFQELFARRTGVLSAQTLSLLSTTSYIQVDCHFSLTKLISPWSVRLLTRYLPQTLHQ